MSLARLAMRITAARALKGATLAGGRVFDSVIAPIDQTIAEERQPILIVTTDDHEVEVTGRDLVHGNVSCDLVIEAAIAARVELSVGDESQPSLVIPHTDEGMELALDLLEHQVVGALLRESSDWSRVFMGLVPRISRRISRRGASVEKGVRFAARQVLLTCDLIEAPASGAAILPASPWADLLAVLSEDPDLSFLATLLREEIEGTPLMDWQRAANILAVSRDTGRSIGLGPLVRLAVPIPLDAINLEGDISSAIEPHA
jgi:hypothetical protein